MSLDAMLAEAVARGVKDALTQLSAPQLLLTLDETATMLSFSKDTVRRLIEDKEIVCVGEGARLRVERRELDRWIEKQRRP